MKHIYLIRHGRQNAKECNVDVPLSPEGRIQAELLRDRLASFSFDKFYSSTLIRACETADIVNEKQKMDIERRSELNEIDWGDLTGQSIKEMYVEHGDFLFRRSLREQDMRFPGGENGEDVFRRAKVVFDEIAESPFRSILIVTHGGLIRAMIGGLLGIPFRFDLAFGKMLENTGITEFAFDEKTGMYTLERLNDASHLETHPELSRNSWGLYR